MEEKQEIKLQITSVNREKSRHIIRSTGIIIPKIEDKQTNKKQQTKQKLIKRFSQSMQPRPKTAVT